MVRFGHRAFECGVPGVHVVVCHADRAEHARPGFLCQRALPGGCGQLKKRQENLLLDCPNVICCSHPLSVS